MVDASRYSDALSRDILHSTPSRETAARLHFACGVAHDCNHLLGVVRMQSALLFGDSRLPADLRENLRPIIDASERAAELNRQLLAIGGKQRTERVPVDLRRVAADLTPQLRRVAGEKIALATDFAAELPAVPADRGMLERALLNLVTNARDAIEGEGRITLSLGAVVFSGDPRPDRPAGRYVCLAVTDSGRGIPREQLGLLFDPGFTTRPPGRGSGFGLATVAAIVDEHHGWVDVHSVEGRGATLVAFLPAAAPVTAP